MSRERMLHFTFSGEIELGDRVIEVPPKEYRLYLTEHDNGNVTCTELRHKKGEEWLRDKLLRAVDEVMTSVIEGDIEEDERRMEEDCDTHRWRYGS